LKASFHSPALSPLSLFYDQGLWHHQAKTTFFELKNSLRNVSNYLITYSIQKLTRGHVFFSEALFFKCEAQGLSFSGSSWPDGKVISEK